MYLEGMTEASIFVHVAINDLTGKVNNLQIYSQINFSSFENSTLKTLVFLYEIGEDN